MQPENFTRRELQDTGLSTDDYEITIFAKNQPEYLPLPAIRVKTTLGRVVSSWKLSIGERLAVLVSGRIYLSQLTFGHPLQPIKPTVGIGEAFK